MQGEVDEKILKRKIKYYFENQLPVHISLKSTRFLNGKILEFAGDMIIVNDHQLGAVPVYFQEIKYVEPFREKEEEKR
jgi:hypothetical protein